MLVSVRKLRITFWIIFFLFLAVDKVVIVWTCKVLVVSIIVFPSSLFSGQCNRKCCVVFSAQQGKFEMIWIIFVYVFSRGHCVLMHFEFFLTSVLSKGAIVHGGNTC